MSGSEGAAKADAAGVADRGTPAPHRCLKCGEVALVLLGETRNSKVFRCEACGDIVADRRA